MPLNDGGAPRQESADHHQQAKFNWADSPCRIDVAELGAQLARRRAAAKRCEPLPCGHPSEHHRDPLQCLAFEGRVVSEVPTDRQLDAWEAAADHLDVRDTPAVLPSSVALALWRRRRPQSSLPACTGRPGP